MGYYSHLKCKERYKLSNKQEYEHYVPVLDPFWDEFYPLDGASKSEVQNKVQGGSYENYDSRQNVGE